jgi:hypothetical protein
VAAVVVADGVVGARDGEQPTRRGLCFLDRVQTEEIRMPDVEHPYMFLQLSGVQTLLHKRPFFAFPLSLSCPRNEAANEMTTCPPTVLAMSRELFALDALPIYRHVNFPPLQILLDLSTGLTFSPAQLGFRTESL